MTLFDGLSKQVQRLKEGAPPQTETGFRLTSEDLVPRLDLLSSFNLDQLKAFCSELNAKYQGCTDFRDLAMKLDAEEVDRSIFWRDRGRMLEKTK